MLEKIAIKTINEYNLIEYNDKIIVGVSGGADSIALLFFINSIKNIFNLKIFAVHINHCMRNDESDADEKLVIDFCNKLNVPLKIFSYKIKDEAKKLKKSIEETGRIYRYKSFDTALKQFCANKIAVAHNKNDNVETFFMRIFRGTSINGLSSIPFKRDYIIRPFLNCDRNIIENYCYKNNLVFRNDSSNFEEVYTRNKIRLKLIPFIKENFNENLIATISNTIYNINEENIFLENLSKKYFQKCIHEKTQNYISINLSQFNKLEPVIKKRIIKLTLSNFSENLKNISSIHINDILSLLEKQSGKMLTLPHKITVKNLQGYLYFFKNFSTKEFSYNLYLEQPTLVNELNKYFLISKNCNNIRNFSQKVYTINLSYDIIKNTITLRTRKPGDTIFLNGINKKVKNLFIDLKIPSFKRNLIPLLISGQNIVAIPPFFVSDNYKIKNNNKNTILLHIWEA